MKLFFFFFFWFTDLKKYLGMGDWDWPGFKCCATNPNTMVSFHTVPNVLLWRKQLTEILTFLVWNYHILKNFLWKKRVYFYILYFDWHSRHIIRGRWHGCNKHWRHHYNEKQRNSRHFCNALKKSRVELQLVYLLKMDEDEAQKQVIPLHLMISYI